MGYAGWGCRQTLSSLWCCFLSHLSQTYCWFFSFSQDEIETCDGHQSGCKAVLVEPPEHKSLEQAQVLQRESIHQYVFQKQNAKPTWFGPGHSTIYWIHGCPSSWGPAWLRAAPDLIQIAVCTHPCPGWNECACWRECCCMSTWCVGPRFVDLKESYKHNMLWNQFG